MGSVRLKITYCTFQVKVFHRLEAMSVEENIDYEFDENVEDYSDDVDYEADEAEQETTAHVNKKFKSENTERLLDTSVENSSESGSNSAAAETKDDKKDVGAFASLLETKYSDIKTKYEEAQKEIADLKRKKDAAPIMINPDERVKQLEDRVVLIKTKAKEKIAEKDAIIEEQNEKLKKFEDILALLEVNCKQAVVKYNDAQVELAKKEETLQLHVSFKNRYDYKVNFLDEKCRKMQHDYEIKIRKMEERFAAGGSGETTQAADVKDVKEPVKDVKKPVKDVKEPVKDVKEPVKDVKKPVKDVKEPNSSKRKDDGFAFPKKPKTLRIAKVEPAQQESKLPKVVKGLTIKEVLPATEDAGLKDDIKVSDSEETSKIENEPANATESEESVKDESKSVKDDTKQIVSNLPGVKIT